MVVSTKLGSPANFLDLGCGTGWAVCYAATLLEGKGRLVGIDISKGMIEKAKRHALGFPTVEFLEANAENLPCKHDYFDTVICSNSFHHYLHPEQALKEVTRVLKLHGKIYILDVNADDFLIQWIDKRARL